MLGEHKELGYVLHGPLPTGTIVLKSFGYQQDPHDGLVQAKVLLRPAAGAEQTLLMAEGAMNPDPMSTLAGWIDASAPVTGPLGACGDLIIVTFDYVSGTPMFFNEYALSELSLP